MGCPQRRALRGGAAEDRDATKHHDGAEESARAKVTCAQRLRRAERRAAPSFDGAADGGCADQEGTLKGVVLNWSLTGCRPSRYKYQLLRFPSQSFMDL